MKAASIQDIKQQLAQVPAKQMVELCLRLAKFKKENKELLSYLLFEAGDEHTYIQQVKEELTEMFAQVNTSHIYFAKKTLRKILRNISKHIRYTGSATAEAELLLYFCAQLAALNLPMQKSTVLYNIYQQQIKKARKAIDTLHEDLQYEYEGEWKRLASI